MTCRRPGNGAAFLDLVAALTGKPLAGDAWVEMLQEPTEALLASERADNDAAVAAGPRFPPGAEVDIGALPPPLPPSLPLPLPLQHALPIGTARAPPASCSQSPNLSPSHPLQPQYTSNPKTTGMRVILVHGDAVIADSSTDGGLLAACRKFKAWVRATFFGGK